jgi:hypothetical protein
LFPQAVIGTFLVPRTKKAGTYKSTEADAMRRVKALAAQTQRARIYRATTT